jgi:tetratricopeptide (TPR) repeat protein
MSASTWCSRFRVLSFGSILIFPPIVWAQSSSVVAQNNYRISVQDLKMGNKGQKAFDKGSTLLQKGDAEGSLPYLDQAIAEYPEHYKAYYDLGVAHYRLGHLSEAEQAFQKSIDLTGGRFALPQFGMGMVLCERQEFRQAETVIQRGLENDPGSPSGKYILGWAQYGLNKLIDAERSLRQAVVHNTGLAEAYLLLARIHQRQSNPHAVVKDLQDYLQVRPNGPESEQAKRLLERTHDQVKLDDSLALVPMLNP